MCGAPLSQARGEAVSDGEKRETGEMHMDTYINKYIVMLKAAILMQNAAACSLVRK